MADAGNSNPIEEVGSLINSSVWVRDSEEAWVIGDIHERKEIADGKAEFVVKRSDNGELTTVTEETLYLCNIFEDGGTLSDVTDLTLLTHLHEPAVLEALSRRFDEGKIYTNTGPILLAVNPFKRIPGLYTQQLLEMYYSTGILKSQNVEAPKLPPHIYATGDNAYRALVDSGDGQSGSKKQNQSILVSGESGAGKTESTKFIMRYLATVANQKSYKNRSSEEEKNEMDEIADMVLKSNPILESFGNARTNRNDNSSRFGKFIEMQFNVNGNLVGAKIQTYLLEKVRLSRQAEGERNYHIFYQLMKGSTEEQKKNWKLDCIDLDTCGMTRQSNCLDRKDGVDDESTHERMWNAMDIMGFTGDEKETIVKIVSGIMHLSNVKFLETVENGDAGSKFDIEDENDDGNVCRTNIDCFKELLQLESVPIEDIEKALCWRKRTVNKEVFNNCLSPEAASDARDALGKTIYSRMFDWIVTRVNESIQFDEKKLARKEKLYFIGVLDIFGFEVFEHNSFEQLCINYANETLQQQFNQFVFKLEQMEYEKENIKWDFIDFPDNQKCLTLIDGKKPPGILKLLDEQCLFPNGNDEKFARKLYEQLESKEKDADEAEIVFSASSKEKVDFKFCVHHYAGKVPYDTTGFCEKNKDQLFPEALELMGHSEMPLMKILFPPATTKDSKNKAGNSIQAVTVGTQFKGQLSDLLERIRSTAPHYVRCLKPNDKNVSDELWRQRLVDQLRYGGVLEAVKVARAGYPVRMLLPEFGRRYACLVMKDQDVREHIGKRTIKAVSEENGGEWLCSKIIEKLGFEKFDDYQIGKTKLFIRKPVYETLEEKRSLFRKVSAVRLQAASRRMIHMKRYKLILASVLRIQRKMRIVAAKAKLVLLRKTKASTIIQKNARRMIYEQKYLKQRNGFIRLQAAFHGKQARKATADLRRSNAVTKIAAVFLGTRERKRFKKYVSAVVSLQCIIRGASAKRQLKTLKVEARQVGNLQGKLKELQNKVASLTKDLKEETERRVRAEEEKAALEGEMQTMSASNTTDEIRTLRAALQAQRAENGSLMEKLEDLKSKLPKENESIPNGADAEELEKLKTSFAEEKQQLKEELNATKGEMSYWKNQMYDNGPQSSPNKEDDVDEDVRSIKLYNEELESKVDELKKVCIEQREELNKLYMNNTENTSSALEEKVERLTILCNEKSEEVSRLNDKLLQEVGETDLGNEIAHLQGRVAEVETEKSTVQDLLDESKSQTQSLAKQLDEEKEQVDALEKEVEHVSTRLAETDAAKNALEDKLDRLNEQYSDKIAEIDRLNKKLVEDVADKDLSEEIVHLQKRLSEVEADKQNIQGILDDTTRQGDSISKQLEEEREQVLVLEKEVESATQRAVEADSSRDAIEEKLNRITNLYNEKTEEIARLNEKLVKDVSNSDLGSEVVHLQNRVVELEGEKTTVYDELDEIKRQNEVLAKQLEDEKDHVDSLEKQLQRAAVLETAAISSGNNENSNIANSKLGNHSDMEELKQILENHKIEKQELVEITMDLQKEKEELTKTRNDFAEENIALKKKSVEVEEKLAAYVTRMCDAENRANEHQNEFVSLKKENQKLSDSSKKLEEKLDAMEILAEQASGVKIALAKRLEELILENRTLNGSVNNFKDEVTFYKDSVKMLTHELRETQQQLRVMQRKGQVNGN